MPLAWLSFKPVTILRAVAVALAVLEEQDDDKVAVEDAEEPKAGAGEAQHGEHTPLPTPPPASGASTPEPESGRPSAASPSATLSRQGGLVGHAAHAATPRQQCQGLPPPDALCRMFPFQTAWS